MTYSYDDLSYEAVDEVLAEANLPQDASEVHGLLTGCVCAGIKLNQATWCETLLGIPALASSDDVLAGDQHQILAVLFQYTCQALGDTGFDFDLLLPDSDEPMGMRLQCVSAWCQGFLFGLNMIGKELSAHLSDDARDVLEDVKDMVYLDANIETATQEDEDDYTQITEYLRMVAIMIFCELVNRKSRAAPHALNKNVH